MAESPVEAVQESLILSIQQWPGLIMLRGDKAYLRESEIDHFPYILVGQVTSPDANAGYKMRPGSQLTVALACWGNDIGEATDVWQELYKLLHGKTIPLANHLMLRGALSYVTDLNDPTRQAWQVGARYRARTVMAA